MRKIIPYILILSVLVGLFSPVFDAQAQPANACTATDGAGNSTPIGCVGQCDTGTASNPVFVPSTQTNCTLQSGKWMPSSTNSTLNTTTQQETPVPTQTEFQKEVQKKECGLWPSGGTLFPGCVLQISYGLLYQLPAFLLAQTAYFFNVLISVTLNGDLFKSPFVSTAWAVVRDLSNIFFILILLYVAIKLILGLGGHDGKKMIATVILMALLINFSMFFTKVIIDSSNILGLVFYNKLNVETSVNGVRRDYAKVGNEKDVAGGMVAAFDPTTTLKPEFFEQARKVYVNGIEQPSAEDGEVPASTLVALIVMAGLIMCFSIYALFVSALSFVGRLLELWVVIIFSPFAFTSYTIPLLGKVEYLGWSSWVKRLLSSAFMAPIFMFFLYFIFLLIRSNVFSSIVQPAQAGTTDAAGMIKMLLGVVLPTLLILILLLQATKFAKKGGGAVGQAIVSGATKLGGLVVGGAAGLAVGAAAGGTAMALRGTVGRGAANLAESNRMRDWAARSKFGEFVTKRIGGVATKSFDLRKAPGAEGLAKKAGINLGAAKTLGLGPKEGFAQNRAAAIKKKEEFVTKQIDTSDKGLAEMTRGNMSAERAAALRTRMEQGGMPAALAAQREQELMMAGILASDVKSTARFIDAAKRNIYADRLEERDIIEGAGVLNAKKRIMANKIRKSAQSLTEDANIARTVAALAAATPAPAVHATPAVPAAATAPAPAAPAAGGAHPPAGGAGGAHP